MGWVGWIVPIGLLIFAALLGGRFVAKRFRESARRANADEWARVVEQLPEDSELRFPVQPFFLADGISLKRFLGNYQALTPNSRREAAASVLYPDLVRTTPSVRPIMLANFFSGDSQYPLWFAAAYPDVVKWMVSMTEQGMNDKTALAKVMYLIGGDQCAEIARQDGIEAATEWIDRECLDSDRNLKAFSLRRLVDYYPLLTKRRLECAI